MPIVLLAAGIFILCGRAAADFDLKKWHLWREVRIDPQPEKPAYFQIELDGPVFAGARQDLEDLRVVDQAGVEVPTQLVIQDGREHRNFISLEMLDRTLAPDGRFSFVVDLGEEPVRHNRVILSTSAVNFSRRVRIETGPDNKTWAVTREDGYIFSFRPDSTVRNLAVEYPISTKRFLRVTVFNQVNRKEEPIEISRAEVAIDAESEPQLIVPPIASQNRTEDSKDRATIIDLDLGYPNYPTTAVEFQTGQSNFHRHIEIYGKQRIEEDSKLERLTWSRVGDGEIHQVALNGYQSSNLRIDYQETDLRYLRLKIFHLDDRPVTIDRIRILSRPRRLVFRADPGSSYRLFYGNSEATRPRYDLEKMIRYIDLNQARTATLGPQQGEVARPTDGTEQEKPGQPAWLIGTLIASALVLIWLIIRLAKKTVA
ncbi:MAG: DUF3999 family protein [Acidobacteriota bacterium]|nr:MAG: DUF3999 family protein [Acidobacteriota bacterium]